MASTKAVHVSIVLISVLAAALVAWIGYVNPPPQTLPEAPTGGGVEFKLMRAGELQELLSDLESKYEAYGYRAGAITVGASQGLYTTGPEEEAAQPPSPTVTSTPYSSTNVQVEGIDEADVVKLDGTYMYIAKLSEDYYDCVVCIVKAYPPDEMELLSTLHFDSAVEGLYVYGDKLVVLETPYPPIRILKESEEAEPSTVPPPPYVEYKPTTSIMVYDVTDKSSPQLIFELNVTGYYVTSRLKDGVLYVVSEYCGYDVVPLVNGTEADVWVPKDEELLTYPPTYVTIATVDLDDLQHEESTYMIGGVSRIYMSHENLYVVTVSYERIFRVMAEKLLEVVEPKLPQEVLEEVESCKYLYEKMDVIGRWFSELPEDEQLNIMLEVVGQLKDVINGMPQEETYIYRFKLDEVHSGYCALGVVPGRVLDQFALHEAKGYFMVATTVTRVYIVDEVGYPPFDVEWQTENCFYTLDVESMEVAGRLEGLAEGESIYAARFMGDMAYLVTFRRVDPLYGIDISDPANPKVVGYLKELGYSEYLHPYGDNYLIGVGVSADEEGRAEESRSRYTTYQTQQT